MIGTISRLSGARSRIALGVALLLGLGATPARAVAPDGASAREPYLYPTGPEEPAAYPDGWVRVPAVAADLVLVRPAMVVGLAAGAVAFVATLPITAPTLTTDDAAHALFDQTLSALARPLGEF
ncbi:MAG: hypothetical protein OZ948_07290 [Deltaproteobacteria bacterium]|nr:hypothetical protein [Deltaproteobacteria bacterium]